MPDHVGMRWSTVRRRNITICSCLPHDPYQTSNSLNNFVYTKHSIYVLLRWAQKSFLLSTVALAAARRLRSSLKGLLRLSRSETHWGNQILHLKPVFQSVTYLSVGHSAACAAHPSNANKQQRQMELPQNYHSRTTWTIEGGTYPL